MKIRRGHIMKKYGVEKKTLDLAIKDESLTQLEGGYYDEEEVVKWLVGSDKRGPRVLDALARAGVTKNEDGTVSYETPQAKGAGLVDDATLERLAEVDIPDDLSFNAEKVMNLSKALTGLSANEEKAIRNMKEVGRLVDLREAESVLVDLVVMEMVKACQTLSQQYASSIAKKSKQPLKAVKPVLAAAETVLLEKMQSIADGISPAVERIMNDKAAVAKRKK